MFVVLVCGLRRIEIETKKWMIIPCWEYIMQILLCLYIWIAYHDHRAYISRFSMALPCKIVSLHILYPIMAFYFPKELFLPLPFFYNCPTLVFLQFVTVKLFPFFRFSKGRNLTLKGHKRLSQMRRNGEDMLDREKELKMDPQKRWSLKANLSTQKTISRFLLTWNFWGILGTKYSWSKVTFLWMGVNGNFSLGKVSVIQKKSW